MLNHALGKISEVEYQSRNLNTHNSRDVQVFDAPSQATEMRERLSTLNSKSNHIEKYLKEIKEKRRLKPPIGEKKKSTSSIANRRGSGGSISLQQQKNEASPSHYHQLQSEFKTLKNIVSEHMLSRSRSIGKQKKKQRSKSKSRKKTKKMSDTSSDSDKDSSDADSDSSSVSKGTLKNYSNVIAGKVQKSLKQSAHVNGVSQKKLLSENKKLKEQILKMKTEYKQNQETTQKAKEELFRAKVSSEQNSSQIENIKIECESLNNANRRLAEQLDELTNLLSIERQTNIAKKQKWSDAKSLLKKEVDQLKESFSKQNHEKSILELRYEDAIQKNHENQKKNETLGVEIDRLKNEMEEVQIEAMRMQETHTSLRSEIQTILASKEELVKSNNALQKKVNQLEDEKRVNDTKTMKRIKDLQDIHQKEIANLKEGSKAIQNELDTLNNFINNEESIKQESQEYIAEMESLLHKAEIDLQDYRNKDTEIDRLKEKNKKITESLETTQKSLLMKDKEINELEKKLSLTLKDVDTYKEDIKRANLDNQKTSDFIDELSTNLELCQQERDLLKSKHADLSNKIQQIEEIQAEELEAIETRVEGTLSELRLLRSENEELSLQNRLLQDRVNEEAKQGEGYKSKYKSKKNECNLLREKCMKLDCEVNRLNSLNMELFSKRGLEDKQYTEREKKIKV